MYLYVSNDVTTFSTEGTYKWGDNKGYEVNRSSTIAMGNFIAVSAAAETGGLALRTAAPYVAPYFKSLFRASESGTAAAVAGDVATTIPKSSVPTGEFYSVAYETQIPSHMYPTTMKNPYWQHFKAANTALDAAIQSDVGDTASRRQRWHVDMGALK